MSDLSAEKVVAELRAGADGWEIAVEHEISLYGDGTEDAIGMQARADMYRRAADLIAQQAARLEEVTRERDEWRNAAHLSACEAASGLLDETQAALTAAEAEKERLREALKPFAREADARSNLALGPDIDYWPIGGSALTMGDLRRARAALSEKEQTDV